MLYFLELFSTLGGVGRVGSERGQEGEGMETHIFGGPLTSLTIYTSS